MQKRHSLCSSGSIYRAFFVGKTNLNGLLRKTAMLFVPAPLFQRQKIAALRSPAVGAEWILSNLSKALLTGLHFTISL